MKKTLLLCLCLFMLFSCENHSEKELIFLNKNAYEYPVWEDMLQDEKIKFSDVVLAFKAYASTHDLDRETLDHFKKIERRLERNLDADGYYVSQQDQYKNLLAFRRASPNTEATQTNYSFMPTAYTAEVPNSTSYGQWKNLGPFGDPEVQWTATGNGAIQYLEMHPTNPAIMYACSRNGGLWKTVNYGKNWTPETDYFATNNTSCIEVCPANPAVLYLGAAEDEKIWYSSNSGATWEDRSTGITGEVYDVHSDPADATRALVATTQGLFLTTNSGANWTKKVNGSYTDIDATNNWDLVVVSNNANGSAPVLYFTKDKGDNFIEKNIITHLTTVDRFYMALHKPTSGATQVFAYGLLNGNTPTRFIGLWKSDFDPSPADGTSYFNFTEVKHPTYSYPNGPVPLEEASNADGFKAETSDYYGSINPYSSATWISDFYVSPTNPNRMLTLREKFWGSEDGGIIWDQKPSYGLSNWADNRYAVANITKDTVFWCNDGGIWGIKESDLFPSAAEVSASGLSKTNYINSKVVPKNGDICVSEGSQMDVSPLNKGVFMTGGQDIGQIFTRNGRDSHVASADVYRGRIKPTDDSKFITGRLDVTLDGSTDTYAVYNNIEADYFNADRIYGFTNKNQTTNTNDVRLVRSPAGQDGWLMNGFKGENQPNAGGHFWVPTHSNWEEVPTGISDLKPGTFEQSRVKAERAYLGDETGKKLYYTENLSAVSPTWTELTSAPPASRYRIATHPLNEKIIALATNSGVYVSKDKGQTWGKRGNFPSNNPTAIVIDKNTSEGLYVLTPLTVYYMDENLSEWVEFNKGLPLQNLSDMRIAYFPNNDGRLYVSKYGRGVWSSSLQSVLNANGNKPKAAFSIFGNDLNIINPGETIRLIDQSSNATNLQWTLENGSDIVTISNETEPEVALSTQGYYKVTLVATNANGSDTAVKEQYVLVQGTSQTTADCVLTSDATLPWYKGLKTISLNNDAYAVSSRDNYIASGKVFEISGNQTPSLYIDDIYDPGYNFYIKAWIDFNDDGDFDDANEEIATSGGKVESFTANFTVPASAVLSKGLLMRVGSLETASSTAPTSCQTTGTRQNIDFTVIIRPNYTITAEHTLLSVNSADLSATFSGTATATSAGFVYANTNGNLTVDSAEVATYDSTLGSNGSYTVTLSNLDYNGKYYYRPFIRNSSGIVYGDVQSFQLAPFALPQAESLIAVNQGSDQWTLKGIVMPENNTIDLLEIEYGTTSLSNTISFTPSAYPTNSNFNIEDDIGVVTGNTYQFRVKFVSNGKTYYSNIFTFDTNQTLCTPTVQSMQWYKTIKNVTFNGTSNDSPVAPNNSSAIPYEDFSSTVFDVEQGSSYPISITDSYPGYNNLSYIVYIDYNNDGDFSDYHEVAISGKPGGETFTGTITIPTADIAYATNLRMRVMAYSNSVTPCEVTAQGQVEDYSIKIAMPPLSTEIGGSKLSHITLYPNPAVSDLYVYTSENKQENIDVKIYNMAGALMYSGKHNFTAQRFKLNVSPLASGLYLVKVSSKQGSNTLKFIKG